MARKRRLDIANLCETTIDYLGYTLQLIFKGFWGGVFDFFFNSRDIVKVL